MTSIVVKHVNVVRSRKGKVYRYHRITGEKLPDDDGALAARVEEINRSLANRQRPVPGTVAAVIDDYLETPEFKGLADNSRRLYRLYLDDIRRVYGKFQIADIRRAHIKKLRTKLAGTPGRCNVVLKMFRIVMAQAVEMELRTDNPVSGIKPVKGGGSRKPWPPEVIEAFLAAAPADMAMACKLGLYTGQRVGDILAMKWCDIDGTAIQVAQEKTGERVWIPMHRELRAALAGWPRTGPTILDLPRTTFDPRWQKAKKKAGIKGYVFHGLRYTAAGNLAEVGCSTHEIAAITGHQSLAMLQKYTRHANQKRLAGAAIRKLEAVKDD